MSLFYINETNTLKNHKEKVGDIMTSLKMANRRVGSLFAVAALVLATVTPGLIPAFASAAQLSERSIELSSSSKTAEDVDYKVTFTSVLAAKVVLLDFCSNSPLIGSDCTAPAGFDVSGATATGGDFAVVANDASAASTVVLTGTVGAEAEDVTFTLEGVKNPSAAGPLYVRILTYDGADTAAAEAKADAYEDTNIGDEADQGTAGASITDTIGVSGAVLETLTFCVAGNQITDNNCTRTDAAPLTAPTLRLGQGSGNSIALASNAVSEGSIYSQLSTNADGGAVVNLKSGNTCGGLKRGEATGCDIAAALAGGIAAGEAKFGIKVATGSDPSGASGTFQIAGAGSAYYSSSVFKLNYVAGGASGVTSVFGDSVLDTAGDPVNNKNAQITFGASIANNTPAGLYSNDFSLIATGKY